MKNNLREEIREMLLNVQVDTGDIEDHVNAFLALIDNHTKEVIGSLVDNLIMDLQITSLNYSTGQVINILKITKEIEFQKLAKLSQKVK